MFANCSRDQECFHGCCDKWVLFDNLGKNHFEHGAQTHFRVFHQAGSEVLKEVLPGPRLSIVHITDQSYSIDNATVALKITQGRIINTIKIDKCYKSGFRIIFHIELACKQKKKLS